MTDYNDFGLRVVRRGGDAPVADVTGMFSPVRCAHCRHVYDVGTVEVVARYLDCSMWHCPGCTLLVDDRPTGWKSRCDIEWLNRDGTVRR